MTFFVYASNRLCLVRARPRDNQASLSSGGNFRSRLEGANNTYLGVTSLEISSYSSLSLRLPFTTLPSRYWFKLGFVLVTTLRCCWNIS